VLHFFLALHKMENLETFQCNLCMKIFKSKSGLSTHSRTCKSKENIICNFCNNTFSTKNYLNSHYSSCKHKEIEDLRTQFQNQHLNDIEKLKIIYETRIKDLEDQHKSINSRAETRIRDLEAEVKSKNEQINLLKEMKPSVINNTVNNNNYQNNSSTKIGNINAINTKLRLGDDFFQKLRNNFDEKQIFRNETDVCRYTLSQGLSNYVLLLDRSRKVLGFEDAKGNQIRDHDGIQLARKIYKELTPCFENITEKLKDEKENPNDYFVPTTLDQRKRIASMIAEKNQYSLKNFGKSIFEEFPKYNSIENSEEKVEMIEEKKPVGVLQQVDEDKKEFDEIHEIEEIDEKTQDVSELKASIRKSFIATKFEAIKAGVQGLGASLVQFLNIFKVVDKKMLNPNDSDDRSCEWFKVSHHNQTIKFTPQSFFNLIQECFNYEDIPRIMSSIDPVTCKEADRFIKIFILRQYEDENIEDIKQQLAIYTVGLF